MERIETLKAKLYKFSKYQVKQHTTPFKYLIYGIDGKVYTVEVRRQVKTSTFVYRLSEQMAGRTKHYQVFSFDTQFD